MDLESIFQLEDALDRLEHTRKCLYEYLANKKPCQCGLNLIKQNLLEYRENCWREKRET